MGLEGAADNTTGGGRGDSSGHEIIFVNGNCDCAFRWRYTRAVLVFKGRSYAQILRPAQQLL